MSDVIRIFIAGDVLSTIDYLSQLLEREEDIKVLDTAETGLQALQKIRRVKPDVMLMDVNLPDMDGIEATSHLVEQAPSVPVIIMSDQENRENLKRAMQAGAREFLLTPIDSDDLIASIRRVYQFEQRKEIYAKDGDVIPPGFDEIINSKEALTEEALSLGIETSAPEEDETSEDVVEEDEDLGLPDWLKDYGKSEPETLVEEETQTETELEEASPDRQEVEPEEAKLEATEVAEEEKGDIAVETVTPGDDGSDWFSQNVIREEKPGTEPQEPAESDARKDYWVIPGEVIASPDVEHVELTAEFPALEPVEGKGEDIVVAGRAQGGVGEMIQLFSGKGGVGTSTIATNLAFALARETGAKVCLVDLDLEFGDLGVFIKLPQTGTIYDLAQNINTLDPLFIDDVLSKGPNDVRILNIPPSPELAELVPDTHVDFILAELRNLFDFVLVDSSSQLSDVNLNVMERATKILLISSFSVASVKSARNTIKTFEKLKFDMSKVMLILNGVEPYADFKKLNVEQTLSCTVAAEIPHNARVVINSTNRASPFVIARPELDVSKKVRELAALLVPGGLNPDEVLTPPKTRRFFSRK